MGLSKENILPVELPHEYYTEAEKKEITKWYKKILRGAKEHIKEGDTKLIRKALDISMEAHKEMHRKSGEPYIYHPLGSGLYLCGGNWPWADLYYMCSSA